MKKRRALLIGVPEYENKKLDLPVVRNDVENLHSSLEKSRFIVRTLGMGDKSETGRDGIAKALRRECRDAKGIETLILYFSGHGVHYEGQDYLVPSNADLDDPDLEDYLVSTDILGHAIDDSDAKTIIFIIDACRHGIELGIKGLGLTSWSLGKVRKATQRSFVIVFACSPGQVSQYVGGEAGFSLFSKALAEVLDPQYPACTLEEVLRATQEKLNALVAEHKKKPQEIRRCFESAVEDDTFSRIICEGQFPDVVLPQTLDPWSEAALNSPLWSEEEAEENSTLAQLKEQVAKILAACWEQWQAAIRALPKDPWRDEKLPIRLLEKLDMLVSGSNPTVALTQAETALVLTVPFVREAVLASGVVQAAQVNPLALEETRPKTGFRLALDQSHQGQPRFLRKAQRLQEQGCIAEKNAVMSWLMHRCLMRSLELWLPEAEGGYLSDDFIATLDDARRCKCRLAKETLIPERLLELARCLFSDLERIDSNDRPNFLQSRLTVVGRSYREEQEIREKMLAYLLKMAELLAIDGRTLSDVLVDHIGLADPLTPEQALHTIIQADWKPSGRSRTLKVTCNHQAVDLALAEHVEQANSVLTHIFQQVAEKREMEALAGLPTHLMPDGIVPEQDGGGPAYQKPHVNFQLAHDEIRELLMGEQLYGDPGLAIRELYQNALDACRYREARLKYLKQMGQDQGLYQQWQGRIIFRQNKDQHGREYIECEDNGIGMAMLHLSQCFARAGRRFADLPEFIEEQAEWLKCDPPIRLYPNSQFGVGVLSYFMLADEIEVETCRLDRQGRPDRKLRVRIPGSSGLFRVRDGGYGFEAGTRVRLYLNRTRHQGKLISCIEILRKLLWVAEFPTEVQQGARREVWEVGRLRHPDISENQYLAVGNNVWWVERGGCMLSDGLRTEEEQPGIVVNLRQDHYPKLTVDRKKIVEWDRRYVRELLIVNSEPLLTWSSLTLEWLWGLSKKYPHVAAHIVQLLSQQHAKVQLGGWSIKNIEVSIAEVGCFAFDEHLTRQVNIQQLIHFMPWWIMPYRVALWGKYGLLKLSTACLESILASMQLKFCPVSEPRDAIVLSWGFEGGGITNSDGQYGQISPAQIVLAAAHLEEPIAVTLKRLQRFASLGLEVSEVNPESLGALTTSEEDLIALSEELEGKKKRPWDKKRMPPTQVVLASARLSEPVAETLKRLQKFTPLGLEVPEVKPESLGELSATREDLIALSSSLDGQYSYWDDQISIAQVILAAKQLNEPIAETLKRLQKFASLGLEVPEIDSESLDNCTVTEEDLIALSEYLDGKSALDKDQVPPAHIVLAADKLKESIAQTIIRLQRFVPLGLEIPQVDFDALENLTPTPEDLTVLSKNLYRREALPQKQVSPAHIIMAAVKLKEPLAETIKRLKRFSPLGLEVPEINVDLESLQAFIVDEKNLIALSKNLNGELPLLKDKVHPARVVIAACELNEPVPVTLERMRRFAPLFGITLPEGEPNSWKIATFKSHYSTQIER